MKRHEKPRSRWRSRSRLRIAACTETSSADTGSSATSSARLDRERAREADALALAARELVRVAVPQLRPQADRVEELVRRCASSARPRREPVQRSGSPTISPHVMRGLSDEYGSWKTMCISRRSGRSSRRDEMRDVACP